jgi:hypothetical protein
MSTASKPRGTRAGLAAAALIALGACIQGPWDYYPEDPPTFQGIFVTGYALAGKPFEHVCFERMIGLKEEATEAFAFYKSADVSIEGPFAGVNRTLHLTAVLDTPNCFKGDSTALADTGSSYALTARFVWDSSGRTATSVLTARANVPRRFKMHDDAKAPAFATQGGAPANIFTIEFFAKLPPDIQATLAQEFPDALRLILKPGGIDTSSQETKDYLKANGPRIRARVLELLSTQYATYHKGDTLTYLIGDLNTLSHYYSDDRSDDVKAVLITQRFEDSSSRPQTGFDSPLGLEPDSADFYFPGSIRRLLIYPDAKGKNGFNLLDSMGVVNIWFHTLRNRLYFYGFEQAYYDYTSTVVDNGGDPRIKPKYNVTGGGGIFAGAVPDSFDVFIRIDTATTKAYPLPITHGLFCSDEGWQSRQDCRDYYRAWCSERNWAPADCGQDAITACLEADADGNADLKARCSPKADSARLDTAVAHRAEERFCVERDFPADNPVCAVPANRCLDSQGANACKQALWNFCLDRAWSSDFPQCQPGLASYCHDRPRTSEVLCSHSDPYCAAHPGSPLCK